MHIYSPTVKVIEVDGERELLKGRGGGDRCRVRTLRRSTERRPLRMHSLSPVPSTITSYSTSMAGGAGAGGRAVPEGGREGGKCGSPTVWWIDGRHQRCRRERGEESSGRARRAAIRRPSVAVCVTVAQEKSQTARLGRAAHTRTRNLSIKIFFLSATDRLFPWFGSSDFWAFRFWA